MGFYPVTAPALEVYDDRYFDRYRGMEATELGVRLTELRLELVAKYLEPELQLVDFGIGSGQFLKAANARGRAVWGFDVMPAAIGLLKSAGLYYNPWNRGCLALACWDSLEHVRNPDALLAKVAELLFVSLPIFRGAEHAASSHHFRPTEHFWYWTRDGFVRWLDELGFDVLERNAMESDAGRVDIETFVARRRR